MGFEVRLEGPLLRMRFFDALTHADLAGLAEEMLACEARLPVTPSRLSSLTEVTHVEVGFSEMLAFVERRRAVGPRQPIRSALVVTEAVQFGIARMFQTLNDHPLVTVCIFHDEAAALAWLGEAAAVVRNAGAGP
ncbi:hypothetical protein [Roseisolibacter agri]|uniref:SpoIIAA-like protein n=1 Tax=Roseisolibacter agri TaxID=2014610 RepID=A0AA37QE93_9BACT|nr:hypothetical protein [Roseisolibacter agri]GLC25143.1 hypothetical protein rosag_16560 [Roseisolibacter agri]